MSINKKNPAKAIHLCLLSQLISGDAGATEFRSNNKTMPQKKEYISNYKYLMIDNNTTDILHHPAFTGFSLLLFPWNDSRRNKDLITTEAQPASANAMALVLYEHHL